MKAVAGEGRSFGMVEDIVIRFRRLRKVRPLMYQGSKTAKVSKLLCNLICSLDELKEGRRGSERTMMGWHVRAHGWAERDEADWNDFPHVVRHHFLTW